MQPLESSLKQYSVTLRRRALQADSVTALSMRFALDIKRSSPTTCRIIEIKGNYINRSSNQYPSNLTNAQPTVS